jgi:signal transduction histidine kinase
MKIRTRLTLTFMWIGAIIMFVSFSVVFYLSANFRKMIAEKRMEYRASTYARLLFDIKIIDNTTLTLIDKNTSKLLLDEQIAIYNDKLQLIYSNCELDSFALNTNIIAGIRLNDKIFIDTGEKESLAFIYKNKNQTYYIISSAVDEYGLNWMNSLVKFLSISLVIGIVLLFFAGNYYAGRALLPISKIIDQAEQINITKLDQRLHINSTKDEIAQLTKTFNSMLQRIEDAFEMQRSFVSNASHELRTPLTKLTSEIEVTLLKQRTVDEYMTTLLSLLEEIKTMNSLANGLLDLAYSSVDKLSLKISEIRIDELLFMARTELINKYDAYKVIIDFAVLPEEESNLLIRGNANLLKTAFINIMDNACKFSSDQQAHVIIETDVHNVIIRVKDKGIGIPASEMPKIWAPFFRAENARSRKGHGIGLPLVRKIVELHRGTIHVNSALNLGTEAIITLPLG